MWKWSVQLVNQSQRDPSAFTILSGGAVTYRYAMQAATEAVLQWIDKGDSLDEEQFKKGSLVIISKE